MEYVALVLFLVQLVAWFILPASKTGKPVEAEKQLGSIGDEASLVA